MMKRALAFLALLWSFTFPINAQCIETDIGLLTPDGRPCGVPGILPILEFPSLGSNSGLAHIGVISADENFSDFYQNPANLSSISRKVEIIGMDANLFRWLPNVQIGILNFGAGFYLNSRHSFGIYQRIFSVERASNHYDVNLNKLNLYNQNETEFAVNYSYSLNKQFTLGMAWKYVNSTLTSTAYFSPQPIDVHLINFGIKYRDVWKLSAQTKLKSQLGLALNNFGKKVTHSPFIETRRPHSTIRAGIVFSLETEKTPEHTVQVNLFYQAEKLFSPYNNYHFRDYNKNEILDFQEYGFLHTFRLLSFDVGNRNWQKIFHKVGFESWFRMNSGFKFGIRSGGIFHQSFNKITYGCSLMYKILFIDISRGINDRKEEFAGDYLSLSLGLRKSFQ